MSNKITIIIFDDHNLIAEMWSELINSAEKHLTDFISAHFILFTDSADQIPDEIIRKLGDRLSIVTIQGLPWPYPTLYRYRYILSQREQIKTTHVMYLDADMLFVNDIEIFHEISQESGIALTLHPGFYRPRGYRKALFYSQHPIILAKDICSLYNKGGIGSWEESSDSMAWVEKSKRNQYVCGGVWFGPTDAISNMCHLLNENIEIDESRGIMARYHDESHLNYFAANHQVTLNIPRLCFDESYPQLKGIVPIIIAVNKNVGVKWVR